MTRSECWPMARPDIRPSMAGDASKFPAAPQRGMQMDNEMSALLPEVGDEIASAQRTWPPYNSAHEGYAVLAEEVDKLWDHVKTNQEWRAIGMMRKEAMQVAAVALRFVIEICDGGRGRR
jgi:hypothetical protein